MAEIIAESGMDFIAEQSLPYYLRQIWNPDVLVINQEMAIKQNLIINGGA